MKIIKKISVEEMVDKFPDAMAAIFAPKGTKTIYCDFCDGLRLEKHVCKCCFCHKLKENCKCYETLS